MNLVLLASPIKIMFAGLGLIFVKYNLIDLTINICSDLTIKLVGVLTGVVGDVLGVVGRPGCKPMLAYNTHLYFESLCVPVSFL